MFEYRFETRILLVVEAEITHYVYVNTIATGYVPHGVLSMHIDYIIMYALTLECQWNSGMILTARDVLRHLSLHT